MGKTKSKIRHRFNKISKKITKKLQEPKTRRYIRQVGAAFVTLGIAAASNGAYAMPAPASQIASESLGTEGGKKVIEEALKVSRTKPALSIATLIVCFACPPIAGVGASPALCVACGILFAKTFG